MTDLDHDAEVAAQLARHEALRRKCFVLAKAIGLTDEDRHELSIMVPGVPEGRPEWRNMSFEQLCRLADFMTGWTFVETVLRDRREGRP